MKEVIKKFGADLEGFKKEVPAVELQLNTRRHMLYVGGSKEDKQRVEGMISELILYGFPWSCSTVIRKSMPYLLLRAGGSF
jgi:hypothetical protein